MYHYTGGSFSVLSDGSAATAFRQGSLPFKVEMSLGAIDQGLGAGRTRPNRTRMWPPRLGHGAAAVTC